MGSNKLTFGVIIFMSAILLILPMSNQNAYANGVEDPIIWNNGSPLSGGFNFATAIAADDIAFEEDKILTDVHFWACETVLPFDTWNVPIQWYVYEDGDGAPGNLLFNGDAINVVGISTGDSAGSCPIFEVTFDLDNPPSLESGLYWIGLPENDFGTASPTWIVTDSEFGSKGARDISGIGWKSTAFDFAFYLTGVNDVGPEVIDVNFCQLLDLEGSIYRLTKDISSEGSCITIIKNDIVFDGNDHSINLDLDVECVEGSNGINVVDVSGITIKNISVSGFNIGILFDNATSSTIIKTNSNENCSHGLELKSHADDNTILESDFSNNDDDNIILRSSDGNGFFDVKANGSDTDDGIDLEESDGNTFTRVEASNNHDNGLDLEDDSENNTFTESEFNNNSEEGLRMRDSSDNTFTHNNFNDSGDDGMDIEDSDRNTFFNNTVINSGNEGIDLERSNDNRFLLNFIAETDEEGFDVEDGSSGNLFSCNVFEDNRRGVEFEGSGSGNIVTGNTFDSNTDVALLIKDSSGNDAFLNNFFNQTDSVRVEGNSQNNDVFDNFFVNSEVVGTTVNQEVQCNEEGEVIEGEVIEPEPDPEPVTAVNCNIPEGTQTEINQSGDNINFTFNATCDVTAGDSTEEIDVKITVDKDAEGLGEEIPTGEVDLNLWTEETLGGGNWIVDQTGFTVLQTVNTPHGTFFYSPFEAMGAPITGQIRVETGGDNDFVGFAIGFQPGDTTNPDAEYLLIDWKQGTQTFNFAGNGSPGGQAPSGLAVSLVLGIPDEDELWQHEDLDPNNDGSVTELARGINLGSTGWVDFTTYEFDFIFTENNFTGKIFICSCSYKAST